MNLGVLLLAILVAAGAVLVIVEAAASQPAQYTDSFGHTYTPATNNTHNIITNGTAPMARFGGGAVVVLAIMFLFLAALGTWAATRSTGNRYSSRHG